MVSPVTEQRGSRTSIVRSIRGKASIGPPPSLNETSTSQVPASKGTPLRRSSTKSTPGGIGDTPLTKYMPRPLCMSEYSCKSSETASPTVQDRCLRETTGLGLSGFAFSDGLGASFPWLSGGWDWSIDVNSPDG